MKLATILTFTATVEALVLPSIEKRQSQAEFVSGLLKSVTVAASKPPRQPVKSTKLQPVLFQNALRQKTIWGPFTLNPANVGSL
jgi:hypothetical protein